MDFVKLTSSIISASPAENMRTGMSLSCTLYTQTRNQMQHLAWYLGRSVWYGGVSTWYTLFYKLNLWMVIFLFGTLWYRMLWLWKGCDEL